MSNRQIPWLLSEGSHSSLPGEHSQNGKPLSANRIDVGDESWMLLRHHPNDWIGASEEP